MDTIDNTKKYFILNLSLIVLVGLVMVYSASYIFAKETFGSSTHFFFKQLLFLVIGLGGACLVAKTKMNFWYKNIYAINIIATILLLLTMTPLGVDIKGSHRWLNLFGFNFQPGEFIKYTVAFSSVYYFYHYSAYELKQRLLGALHFVIPLILLVVQPDFGTFTITSILVAFSCFLSPFPRKLFYSFLTVGIIGAGFILVAAPYRVKRLLVFLDPWSDPQNSGFQIIQSYLAFANGHLFGQGMGNSNEKLFYLPEAYNDFIFSVVGEELGFIGVLFIVLLFLALAFLGFKLALYAKSRINQQLIALFIFSISLQAFLNMGVVLGLLPTKGLNLPFISYGGSSLVANLMAIGLIFSSLKLKSQIDDGEQLKAYPTYKLGSTNA